MVPEDHGRRGERFEEIGELDREYRFRLGQRDEIQPCGQHDSQRALRADHELGHVEGPPGPHELIEVVSAHTPKHLGKAPFDFHRVVRGDRADDPMALRREARARARDLELLRRQRAEHGNRAVREHDFLVEYVIDCLAVEHRPRAAGIVRHHPADGGATGG